MKKIILIVIIFSNYSFAEEQLISLSHSKAFENFNLFKSEGIKKIDVIPENKVWDGLTKVITDFDLKIEVEVEFLGCFGSTHHKFLFQRNRVKIINVTPKEKELGELELSIEEIYQLKDLINLYKIDSSRIVIGATTRLTIKTYKSSKLTKTEFITGNLIKKKPKLTFNQLVNRTK